MKAIFLLALFAVALSVRLQERNMAKVTQELSKSNYGSALLKLAELHSMAGGAVQELLDAIEELVQDLNTAIEELDFNFQVRTNEHNSLVIELEQDIQDAEIDIDRTQDTLDNLLHPRKEQLQNKIAVIQENQDANRKYHEEAILVRAQEHEDFELQVAELNDATASVDEALALLSTLTNPSLLQVKRFQNSLKHVESKIRSRSMMAPMIKALITLASNQNFSDQGVMGQIVEALNEFRNAVVDALNNLTAQEAIDVEEHEAYLQQLADEYSEFQKQINRTNVDLTAVLEKIDQLTEFRNARDADRKQYIASLELENNTYAEETDTYTNLRNEYVRELGITEQALALVSSVDFSNIRI